LKLAKKRRYYKNKREKKKGEEVKELVGAAGQTLRAVAGILGPIGLVHGRADRPPRPLRREYKGKIMIGW